MLPVFLSVVLFSLAVSSVFADPLVAGGVVTVGDQYTVTTISGVASTWINGQRVIDPANLQLQLQVTFVGPHNIVFRVLSGTFQIGNKPYTIDVGHWRGVYNRDTRTSTYQGPATAPDGRPAYFVMFGQDISGTSTGTYMHTLSDFLGEYGALWHVDLTAFRSLNP
jgi:pSer/pThr/pTyr-binding forkhead associated (FHA) protein